MGAPVFLLTSPQHPPHASAEADCTECNELPTAYQDRHRPDPAAAARLSTRQNDQPPIERCDGEFRREPNRNRDDREQQPNAEGFHEAHGRQIVPSLRGQAAIRRRLSANAARAE